MLQLLILTLGCGLAARTFVPGAGVAAVGLYLVWGQLFAYLLHAFGQWCAIAKFVIVGLGLTYLMIDSLYWFFEHRST